MEHWDVLVVGAGMGGAEAALALRQHGFSGSIGLLGEEIDPPYERPPLSKDFLSGDKEFDRTLIRPVEHWAEQNIDLLLGRRITAVAPNSHSVHTRDGDIIGYGKLIWAAGGDARKLSCSGWDLTGVHSVRTRADVEVLRAELDSVEKIVVIGGGYIGLEAASVFRKMSKHVTVLEAQERVLARVAGPPLSHFYQAQHRAHGVDMHFGIGVESIQGTNRRVSGVMLADGSTIAADMAIVGIGIIPAVEPLRAAGATGVDGVDVDEFCRTSLNDIFAIGDCACHENKYAGGRRLRLESVQNAKDQAITATKTILGHAEPYGAVPWFWSMQYDLRLQTVGLSVGYDACFLRGNPETKSFSVVYLREGHVIALDCVNATKDYVQGKKLVLAGASPDIERLTNTDIALKDL